MLKHLNAIWLAILVIGCTSDNELNLRYTLDSEFNVSTSVFILIPTTIDTLHVTHYLDSVLSANDVALSNVKRIELTELSLLSVDSSTTDISILREVNMTIGSEESASLLIGTSSDIPDTDSTSVVMQVTTRDLSPYFQSDQFWLIPDLTTDETVLQTTPVLVRMEFLVETE